MSVCKHTSCPSGYLAWHEWAEKKAKTHDQEQCPSCGLWAIWKKRPVPVGEPPPAEFSSGRRAAQQAQDETAAGVWDE